MASARKVEQSKDFIHVIINSSDRTRGIPESFEIDFAKPIRNVRSIQFDDVVIPTSYYIFSHSGEIDFGGGAISVPNATYTPATLAPALETAMDDAKMTNASVTWDSSERKFTITCDDTFSIEENNQLAHYMGFTSDKTSVTSATSDAVVVWQSRYLQSNRKKFSLTEFATTEVVEIDEGNYRTAELGDHLTAKINASSLSGFTMAYNVNKHIYQLTKASSYTINATSSTDLASWMGFVDSTAASSSVASAQIRVPEIMNYEEIAVISKTIAEQQQINFRYSTDFSARQLFGILPTESPGDVARYRPDDRVSTYFGNSQGITLSRIDINLQAIVNRSDDTANYESIYLNGLDWQFKMILDIL